MTDMDYDVFISHASEDKDGFVRPLAEALHRQGLRVWYDEFSLRLGDSLREAIDRGLASSQYGVVILSHAFFGKGWPKWELDGLVQREVRGRKVILPVWHQVNRDDVERFSLPLAGRVAANSAEGIDTVVHKILAEVKPSAAPAVPIAVYSHSVPTFFEGPLDIGAGNLIEIQEWELMGEPWARKIRAFRILDNTTGRTYVSTTAHQVTGQPRASEAVHSKAGPVTQEGARAEFSADMTDAEYSKFVAICKAMNR